MDGASMGSFRIWLLRLVAGGMLATDLALIAGVQQFQDTPLRWEQWLWLPPILFVSNWTYVVVAGASALLFRRYSASLWLLTLGIVLVASVSLFYRWADYDHARQAWEARQAGTHFMCCAPPGRIAALFLDNVGVGAVVGSALILVAGQQFLRRGNTQSTKPGGPCYAKDKYSLPTFTATVPRGK